MGKRRKVTRKEKIEIARRIKKGDIPEGCVIKGDTVVLPSGTKVPISPEAIV